MTELVLYEAARAALTAAVSVDEVKDIHDRARAMQALARQAKDNELIDKATELRLRAERRLGEMLIEQKETIGFATGDEYGGRKKFDGTRVGPSTPRPTLASVGITKNLSSNAQKLAAMPEEVFDAHLAASKKQAANALRSTLAEKQARRAERESELSMCQLAWPKKIYGVIYADPEWHYSVWSSNTGMDRAAENHYPTDSIERIVARDVKSIAAEDCVLFLWSTVPLLTQALDVMSAWGFDYKSQMVWVKNKAGTGYWFRNKHEILLVGTRGEIPCPAPGEQWDSVLEAPVRGHSQKPDAVYEMIERHYPNLPKIELNARQRRSGWDAWGNEVPPQAVA